ncbi:hypothetical protein DFH28DRAFT_921395 [Melampsora americana]|nr:hypothetical protein DFH28DRAFT_921395 [Melampsora americana]
MSHYSINLGSPIYCTVFVDQDRIILGGGDGSSKSGISNKLWLIQLKPKNKDHLILHEYGLPSGSDSPMSIDLDRSVKPVIVLSGIDSSPTELKLGRNLHLRTFKLLDSSESTVYHALLAVGGSNNQLKLLYYPSLKAAISTPISCPAGELLTVDFSEDGTHARTWTYIETIFPILNPQDIKKGARVLSRNLNDGSLRRSRLISTRPVTAFDLSESGTLLALLSSDLTVSVIDALSLRPTT